jgi:hypothetical protein
MATPQEETMSEYSVEGYGAAARNPEYDGPYLDGADFDPAVKFAFAGDPEKQAEFQDSLVSEAEETEESEETPTIILS